MKIKGFTRPWLVALFLFVVISTNCSLTQAIGDRVRAGREVIANLTAGELTPTRPRATPRPTFTPTPSFTDTPTVTPTSTPSPIPTDTPTPLATDTPLPTDTPPPTNTRRPAAPPPPPPPQDTPTPAPPPPPAFPFKIKEQGDRNLQRTTATFIASIVSITDANGTPLGGYRLVGANQQGTTYESAESSWKFDALSGLEGYVKFGNLKFEPPGGYNDSTWTVHLVDGGGAQVSAPISLTYSSDPNQRYWDFIWWSQ